MGLIHEWSRLAALAPKSANAMLQMPGLSSLAKWVGGIAQQRHIPRYAEQTFVDWFHRRGRKEGGRRVLLWPDTFNNYFRPQTAIAATNVLERLGFAYELLPSGCCGMAGSFGFESEKSPVSMTAAERVLLPRVRAAPSDMLLLANGFSCREQIEQATGWSTTHVAELIAQAR